MKAIVTIVGKDQVGIIANVCSQLAACNINILEIDENLELLSEALRKSIVPGFEEYGLTIPQFYITNVVF